MGLLKVSQSFLQTFGEQFWVSFLASLFPYWWEPSPEEEEQKRFEFVNFSFGICWAIATKSISASEAESLEFWKLAPDFIIWSIILSSKRRVNFHCWSFSFDNRGDLAFWVRIFSCLLGTIPYLYDSFWGFEGKWAVTVGGNTSTGSMWNWACIFGSKDG